MLIKINSCVAFRTLQRLVTLSQSRMYYSMQRKFFWFHMVSKVFKSVRSCSACARHRTSLIQKWPLQLFLEKWFTCILSHSYHRSIASYDEWKLILDLRDWQELQAQSNNVYLHEVNVLCSQYVLWLLCSLMRYSTNCTSQERGAIYKQIVCHTIHSVRRKTHNNNFISPPNKWRGLMIQSYHSN